MKQWTEKELDKEKRTKEGVDRDNGNRGRRKIRRMKKRELDTGWEARKEKEKKDWRE